MPGPITRLTRATDTAWMARLAEDAVEGALRRNGGPCPAAYADILRDYIMAGEDGREALFLAIAWRALGEDGIKPIPNPGRPDEVVGVSAPLSASHRTPPRRRSQRSGS